MAWVVTDRGYAEDISNSNATTVVASFTPTADSLLLLGLTGNGTITSITGHGTWAEIGSHTWAGKEIRLWGCRVGSSPSASAVTVNLTGSWTRHVFIVEVDEDSSGLPASLGDCHGTAGTYGAYMGSGGATFSITLGSFADSGNLAFQIGTQNSTTDGISPESGWTGVHNLGTSRRSRSAYLASEDASPSMYSTTSWTDALSIAVEVKKSGGGGGTTNTGWYSTNRGWF